VSGFLATNTYLDRILTRTAADLDLRRRATSLRALDRLAATRPDPLGLRGALAGPGVAVIAEIKRASPSRGAFPVAVEPAKVAVEYIAGGAAALSVLTDEPFFQGSLADLRLAADAVRSSPRPVPILRKDFVIDEYQIVEARAHGADAVLLIVAALDDVQLGVLLDAASKLGLEALVEVHDERELERAVAAGAAVIGINNRDLRTFEMDLGVSERLAPLAPADAVLVGESGVFTRADIERLASVGVDAVLVGESLIVAPDRAAAVRRLTTPSR